MKQKTNKFAVFMVMAVLYLITNLAMAAVELQSCKSEDGNGVYVTWRIDPKDNVAAMAWVWIGLHEYKTEDIKNVLLPSSIIFNQTSRVDPVWKSPIYRITVIRNNFSMKRPFTNVWSLVYDGEYTGTPNVAKWIYNGKVDGKPYTNLVLICRHWKSSVPIIDQNLTESDLKSLSAYWWLGGVHIYWYKEGKYYRGVSGTHSVYTGSSRKNYQMLFAEECSVSGVSSGKCLEHDASKPKEAGQPVDDSGIPKVGDDTEMYPLNVQDRNSQDKASERKGDN